MGHAYAYLGRQIFAAFLADVLHTQRQCANRKFSRDIYKMPMAAADVMPPATSWEGLKRQADAAFNKGEYIQAVTFYGRAIDTAFKNKTEDSACAKLFANRALTYQRAGEHTNDLSWCCS